MDKETNDKATKLGLNTLNKDFNYINKLKDNVDLIMLWEVLEHLQGLNLFLTLTVNKLDKNRMLIFSVPNFDKRNNYKNNLDKIFQDAPPVNLNFFTERNLTLILKKYGFEIEYLCIKKRPYLNFKSINFYKMLIKSVLGKYNGSTIYLAARKI